jgi:O-antigen chain-terminating methyltransferase
VADPAPSDPKGEELIAILRAVRERVRAGAGGPPCGPLSMPDLLPVMHARDAAEGKAAAIGTVNPRPPGLANNLVQRLKRMVARLLDWHVREQVEFNRAAVQGLDAVIEALNENNRALASLESSLRAMEQTIGPLRDLGPHWAEWRAGWERKLADAETRFLRSVAELQGAFQHRTSLMESSLREAARAQQAEYRTLLDSEALEVKRRAFAQLAEFQQRIWADVERVRADMERTVHAELRLLRQRAALPEAPPAPAPPAPACAARYDALKFAEKFRGSEEMVRERQRRYAPYFTGCRAVVDLGCGRGEFLEVMREAGIPARGIDLSPEAAALCRSKCLEAEAADLFAFLRAAEDESLDGVFAAQVVEHLPPAQLPELARLAAAKLERGGRIALETPNPECLAIYATHFYLDPTHRRPVPPPLLAFYLEEAGFGQIRVERLSPAVESMPALAALPEAIREDFFGALDYVIFARRL